MVDNARLADKIWELENALQVSSGQVIVLSSKVREMAILLKRMDNARHIALDDLHLLRSLLTEWLYRPMDAADLHTRVEKALGLSDTPTKTN